MDSTQLLALGGFLLPYLQLHLNQVFNEELKIGKLIFSPTEQKIALTIALSLIGGLAACIFTGEFQWSALRDTITQIFFYSQLAYYSYFRKLTDEHKV